jgi:hypothetical protein
VKTIDQLERAVGAAAKKYVKAKKALTRQDLGKLADAERKRLETAVESAAEGVRAAIRHLFNPR